MLQVIASNEESFGRERVQQAQQQQTWLAELQAALLNGNLFQRFLLQPCGPGGSVTQICGHQAFAQAVSGMVRCTQPFSFFFPFLCPCDASSPCVLLMAWDCACLLALVLCLSLGLCGCVAAVTAAGFALLLVVLSRPLAPSATLYWLLLVVRHSLAADRTCLPCCWWCYCL